MTQKRADFILFNSIIDKIIKKEHLTLEGLNKLVGIRSSLNLGLTAILKDNFPNVKTEVRPLVLDPESIVSNWLIGFIEAEGCFFVDIFKSKTHKIGYQIKLKFQITQNIRDIALMKKIQTFFNCGNLQIIESRSSVDFVVSSISDLETKIIPLIKSYPLQGNKQLDFIDFCKVVLSIKNKEHLTVEGLEFIKIVKSGMNSGRK